MGIIARATSQIEQTFKLHYVSSLPTQPNSPGYYSDYASLKIENSKEIKKTQ